MTLTCKNQDLSNSCKPWCSLKEELDLRTFSFELDFQKSKRLFAICTRIYFHSLKCKKVCPLLLAFSVYFYFFNAIVIYPEHIFKSLTDHTKCCQNKIEFVHTLKVRTKSIAKLQHTLALFKQQRMKPQHILFTVAIEIEVVVIATNSTTYTQLHKYTDAHIPANNYMYTSSSTFYGSLFSVKVVVVMIL